MATSKGKALTLLNYLSPQRFKHNQSLELIPYNVFFFLGGGGGGGGVYLRILCAINAYFGQRLVNELDL